MNISKILNTENAWIGISLIDITSTGITRGESLERNQQRNWESLVQALSLKTQIEIITYPEKVEDFDIVRPPIFGNFYSQSQTIWAFGFYSEANIYTEELLIKDCDQIPMILGLEETARFMLPLTHTVGSLKNLHFVSTIEKDNSIF
jgi:hypothetical protein